MTEQRYAIIELEELVIPLDEGGSEDLIGDAMSYVMEQLMLHGAAALLRPKRIIEATKVVNIEQADVVSGGEEDEAPDETES